MEEETRRESIRPLVFRSTEAGPTPYLSEVELQDVADVVGGALGQLHQLLAVLKDLTQLLHASLHPIHPVDALHIAARR